jgi:hypothetical protein
MLTSMLASKYVGIYQATRGMDLNSASFLG